MKIDAYQVAKECLTRIREEPWFPKGKGNLAYNGTTLVPNIAFENSTTIKFLGSYPIFKYIEPLEKGSKAHNIPNAFGKGIDFGTYGRYDMGKNRHAFMDTSLFFHPGSIKHQGFISGKSVRYCVEYICRRYNGRVE